MSYRKRLERLHAEEALRAVEARYRTLLHSMDEGFCIVEKVGAAGEPLNFRYVEANPVFAAQTGVSDVVGRTVRQVFPNAIDEWLLTCDTVLKTGEPMKFERRLVAQGRVLERHARRVEDETHCRVAINFKDITERTQAEETLRRRTLQFEFLLEETPLGIYVIDENFRLREANSLAVLAWKGIPPPIIGRDFDEMMHLLWPSEYADEIVARFRYTLETGEPYVGPELIERRLDRGATEAYEWQLNRIPLPDGHYGVVCYFRDVSQRVLAQRQIRESEERYRDLFNSIDEAFCVIEMIFDDHEKPIDYRFLEVNPAFARQTGLEGATGKRMRELVPDLEAYWFEILGNIALTGEPVRFVREAKLMGGRWFDGYALRVGEQKDRKVAVVFNDISERRQSEISLRNAIAAADKANRTKSDFLSSMSHELRTPLNAILGFTQLMESGLPAPTVTQKRNLDQILKAGWYLLELINEILDLAVIESGKVMLLQTPVSLSEVMLECRAMIEPQGQQRSIRLEFPHLETSIFVKADQTRLKQVLINLLVNAIKYNKPGGAVVVRYAPCSPDSIRISVRDTGAGLDAEQLAQLFQPFNRLGKEAGGEEGTGIGLVVTKRLVDLMGGAIGAHSELGVGSVFWIELDLAVAPPVADHHAVRAAPVRAPDSAPLRTLLHMEDNPANLELVEQLIARRPDLHLRSAADGSLGIEFARAHQPAVILMDINLPGISGIEALNILRADPTTAHIPIIALSANAVPRDIAKSLEAGFFDYLTKPIKVNEFMDTLDAALKFSQTTLARAASEEKA